MTDKKPPSAPQYNVATLIDIARIPKERIPALLAQLPRLLDQIRPLIEAVDAAGKEQLDILSHELIWVDDGITDGSSDETEISIHLKP